MKAILSSRRHHYITRISIFLTLLALIVGTVGCGGSGGNGGGGGPYTLTMAVSPGGSGNATDLTGASPYAKNTVVNITAAANPSYQFVSWMSSDGGTFGNATAATTTFTMPAQNVIVTANFFQGQLIRTWYDLDAVRNNLTGSYLLMNNLDSTTAGYQALASPTANSGKGWEPIGNYTAGNFTGSFDGQGYEIKDLFIDRPGEYEVGLFGYVGGRIEDIGVVNVTVTADCGVGGLVGWNINGTVSNCYAIGSVTGNNRVGGLVGDNTATVSSCYSTGTVTTNVLVAGGLVGVNDGGIVSNSYSAATVSGEGAGGLVGANCGPAVGCSEGTIINSYSTGSVTGDNGIGGLVGGNAGTVSDSYATGSVTGNNFTGGLVGYILNGTVSNSYSTGSVTGNNFTGGLVGWNINGTVSYSFWDTQTSGQNVSAGGTGKNTTDMQKIITFSGATWNITTVGGIGERNTTYIWNIVDTVTYPFLSWQP